MCHVCQILQVEAQNLNYYKRCLEIHNNWFKVLRETMGFMVLINPQHMFYYLKNSKPRQQTGIWETITKYLGCTCCHKSINTLKAFMPVYQDFLFQQYLLCYKLLVCWSYFSDKFNYHLDASFPVLLSKNHERLVGRWFSVLKFGDVFESLE